ncbi:MAG: YfaZ family outer membrane protein [Acidiferrobacterales bacterium]
MQRFYLAILMLATIGAAKADGLDIFLNDRTVSVEYLTTYRGSDISFGFLTGTSSNWVASAGLLVLGRDYGSGYKVEGGLGVKVYLTSVGGNSVMAAAIGGQAIYFPRSSKFGVGGFLYYSPDIITFGGSSFIEYGVRAEYRLLETASIYVGLHNVAVSPDAGGNVRIDDGLHVGINLRF